MPWILLTIAGLLEIAFALGMKWSQGFTRPMPGALTALAGLSQHLPAVAGLTLAAGGNRLRRVDRHRGGWHGGGGRAVPGRLGSAPARLACMAAIVGGVIGLKVFSAAS